MARKKTSPERSGALPVLHELHERHPGLTRAVAENYAEAASVALARHHASPTDFEVANENTVAVREVAWIDPDERTARAWGNSDDTTRDGAYALALAAVEAETGLVAIERADTRTGADYYVGRAEQTDLEDALRLEVSGADRADVSEFKRRLRTKVKQTLAGDSDLPALACVVGYVLRKIAMARAQEEE